MLIFIVVTVCICLVLLNAIKEEPSYYGSDEKLNSGRSLYDDEYEVSYDPSEDKY